MQLSRGSGDNGRTINRGRALRALGLGCVVGAVPKMHRPAADRGRNQRQADDAARAEAARKAEARKPKRDQNGDRKHPERELEEEEDI